MGLSNRLSLKACQKGLPLKRRLLDPSEQLTWTPPKLTVDHCKVVCQLVGDMVVVKGPGRAGPTR